MKTFFIAGGAYLLLVGLAQWYSATASNTPTADTLASLPSLSASNGAVNIAVGGGLVVFSRRLGAALGRVA